MASVSLRSIAVFAGKAQQRFAFGLAAEDRFAHGAREFAVLDDQFVGLMGRKAGGFGDAAGEKGEAAGDRER